MVSINKSKSFNRSIFSFLSMVKFPQIQTNEDTSSTIKLIDVLWFEKKSNKVIAAFEVEKPTSIYSGILRLTDLSYSIANEDELFCLVVPNKREKDLCIQLSSPAIKKLKTKIKYILFSDLQKNYEALCKIGTNHLVMQKIAKQII